MVKTSPLPESNVIQDFPCNLQPRILQDPKLQAPRSFISNWVIVLKQPELPLFEHGKAWVQGNSCC